MGLQTQATMVIIGRTRTWMQSAVVRLAVGKALSSKAGLVDVLAGYVVTNVASFDAVLATEVAVRVAGNREGPAANDSRSDRVCADITCG